MANTRQSTKRAALADKRQAQNTIIRSATKTTIRNAVEAINGKDPALAKTAFLAAVSALGHAASKGAIPKTRAARKTSRLTLFTKKVHPAALA